MTMPLEHLRFSSGTTLFSEGEVGDAAYLIKSGEIDIMGRRDGGEFRLARRGAGEIIGEMALIDGGSRSASARVTRDAEVIAISAGQLAQRLETLDPILRMCLGVVIERYRETLLMARTGISAPASVRPIAQDYAAAVGVLTLEREIERGLQNREFEAFLQPIVNLGDRSLAGFEALIRWHHPERGLLPPLEFIPIAESSGFVVQITAWMLGEVVRMIPALMEARRTQREGDGLDPDTDALFVTVNVSGHDLLQPAFADTVMKILDAGLIDPEHLKLEVTESVLMKDPAGAGRMLRTCRDHGIGIAIDDFGTGYSSLSYLSRLPITTLKIDRSFVKALITDPTNRKIVNTISFLARELEIPVVAEGIETEAEATVLSGMRCQFGQGYLFGRPMPLSESLALIARGPTPADRSPAESRSRHQLSKSEPRRKASR